FIGVLAAFSIGKFEKVFEDLLGTGTALPGLSILVLEYRGLFVGVSLAVPVGCIALLFNRDTVRSLYWLGLLLLTAIAEVLIVVIALFLPLATIVEKMQSQ